MFYQQVPRQFEKNIAYRVQLRERAVRDLGFRKALMQACKQDVLFFFSAFCIGRGTPVVTDRGLIPIEDVVQGDMVWDGESWVHTDGAVFRGVKEVIDLNGVKMTPEHKIWTKYGWKQAGEGYEWEACRFPVRAEAGGVIQQRAGEMAVSMRLWEGDTCFRGCSPSGEAEELRVLAESWHVPDSAREDWRKCSQHLERHATAMQQSQGIKVQPLRRPRYQGLRKVACLRELLGGHGREARRNDHRQDQQQRELRAWELSLGDSRSAGVKHFEKRACGHNSRSSGDRRGCEDGRRFPSGHQVSAESWRDRGGFVWTEETPWAMPVYDLLNCGRNHAFTVVSPDGICRRVSNCWLFEPRPRYDVNGRLLPKMIPMIPWDHQIGPIQEFDKDLGVNDIVVFKSRGEGMSWIGVLFAVRDWLFDDMAKVGLVSNTEKKADDPGNLDSLGAKIDWELSKLPSWMVGEKDVDWTRNLTDHSWVNKRTMSQINAFAATADAGRAGRYKWFMADELAFWDRGKDRDFMESIRESTECRIAISTPCGSSGAFYDFVHVPSNVVRIRIHWTDNPYKNRGLYTLHGNVPVAVDPSNPLLPAYNPPNQETFDRWSRLRAKGFRLEGTKRSPWYDIQCDRGDATPQSVAQELDLDFGGSVHRVFSPEFFDKAKQSVRPPLVRGTLSYHPETLDPEFIEEPNGEFKIWCHLDAHHRPPYKRYVVSADIGSGLGGSHTSNSVVQVLDIDTMEQMMQFASNIIEPSEFGEMCVVIAKWWHNAYLGWESNFGGGFTNRVKELGYGNVYYRTLLWKRGKKKTKEIGWNTNPTSKELLFSDFHRMVKTGEFLIHDEDLLRECGEYVRTGPQSGIQHILEMSTQDESSRGRAHGDRVIAIGVGLQLAKERKDGKQAPEEAKGDPAPDTLAWRMKQWEKQDKTNDWDGRTTGELLRA